jgi:carbamoyltransferase
MIQLGLSAFYHDSAAALVIDGKVICAIEEEKLSGEKHDSSFPFKAIQWCLEYTKITIDEIDMVCWYESPWQLGATSWVLPGWRGHERQIPED